MARLYNAGQYNQEFLPRRLGNWEVAKWFPERKTRDPFNFKPTEPIVDDRGRFLAGAPRANRNPWNNYIGTNDQPPRITRAIANELSSRPPNRLRYWDKPNPRLRPVPCAAKELQGGPGFSLVAEGPGYPQHRNYFLSKRDYVEHADRIDEQDVVAVEFLKERKRRQQAVKERVEQVKELTASLRQHQEQQRRDDAERDVNWLLEHRELHNIVPPTHDWSTGAPRFADGCDRGFMERMRVKEKRPRGTAPDDDQTGGSSGRLVSTRSSAPATRQVDYTPASLLPEDAKEHCKSPAKPAKGTRFKAGLRDAEPCWGPGAPRGDAGHGHQDRDEGIHEEPQDKHVDVLEPRTSWDGTGASDDPVRDDGQDSGVGSVDDGHLGESPEPANTKAAPLYPQYEDDSSDLLKPSNPAYPSVDPGFSRRAARDPTIQSYPEPERVREQGYPEMFTTETDLAAPAEDRRETPPPPPPPPQQAEALPRVEGAALKCGRHPRRNAQPSRPYARAQFAVVNADPESPPASPQHRVPTPGPALANAYSSFQVAKQLHKENLEHNPLPDTVNDDLFKKLNSQRHPNPGIALDVKPDAAAVGWRSFNAPGPTNCSKMRVYRPKTAAPSASARRNGLQGERALQRPSTGHPMKLLAKDHVSEMELAICWDLVPAYPEDEPKPTPHIDGSNGSAAPGIFSLVHHPADNEDDVKVSSRSGLDRGPDRTSPQGYAGGPGGTSTPPVGRDRKTPPKPPSVESVHSGSAGSQHNQKGHSRPSGPDHALHERLHAQERQRSAVQRRYNEARVVAAPPPAAELCDFRKRNGCIAGMQGCGDGSSRNDPRNLNDHLAELRKHRHHHQSMPDLSEHQQRRQHARSASQHRHQPQGQGNPRPCVACSKTPSPPANALRRPKSEYKMAFKAGKPTTSLSTNSSFDTPPSLHSGCGPVMGVMGHPGMGPPREVRVPKQRAPFARKNYAITSLTQPFSLWPKETGHAYPEHWRLASVYQHSFKPVHARSKPLLKTVYQ